MRGLAIVSLVAAGLVAVVTGSTAAEPRRVLTYPAPSGQKLNQDFTVRVRVLGGEWQDLDVYEVTVDKDTYSKAGMVTFDADGPVQVAVTKTTGTMRSARVRPLSYGIAPAVEADGKTATFTLARPLNVSFEVNGDTLHNLHVFAGPIADDAPRPGRRVIFFGPGRHQLPGDHVLRVPSNATVYLAGGAVVEGSIKIVDAHNVVVRGRGIIDPSRFFAPKTGATLLVRRSTDVGIRDVTLLRAQDGSITVANSARVVVAGVREITTDPSSDGIFITASEDVLVDDVFLRTSDDAVAVYATTPWYGRGGSRSVTVRNSVLWADVAHPFLTGTHGDPAGNDIIEDIAVQNVDILEHDEFRGGDLYQGALAVNAGNRVTVRDVRFDDVRIEDFSRGQVVNLKVFRNPAFNEKVGMAIQGVLFRDVRYEGSGDSPSRIRGYTSTRRLTDVTFENLVRNGATVLEPRAGNIVVGPHTANVVFRSARSTRNVGGGSRALRYSGRWRRVVDAESHAGDLHTPLRPESYVEYAFVGRQARVLGITGPERGKIEVRLDGRAATTVDTFSTVTRRRQVWFDTGVLGAGSHRLELRYRGASNVLARGAAVGFDGLEIVR